MYAGIKRTVHSGGIMLMLIAVLGSCAARKNTAPSRFYHALNSRYNIYFNGKTAFDDALRSLNEGYKESYTEQIYMYPINGMYKEEKSTTGGPFNIAIDKGNKAIRLHSIKEKPPRKAGWQNDPKQVKLQTKEEFNPFMKHCWLLIAESHFYNGDFLTAAVTYSYIARHFATDPALVAEARIRQARCYTQMDWFYEANNLIKKLNEAGIPPSQQTNYDRMLAEYLIKSDQVENAIPYLQNAIRAEKNKRQRSRMRYLLGQLYAGTGQNELAYQTFGKIAASSPPYEIEFASRIRQTEVFPGGNYEKVLKMLRRMSKSEKNSDFLDQVYYAMGNVYLTQQDTAKAIESYALGIEKSTQNGMDKAICQIRLGDIYFAQKDYLKAQPCFSGAMAGIRKEYKDFDRVSRLSETLDELVVHYEAVHLQDSLQTLSRMTEAERLAVIDKIIANLIEEEKRAEEAAKKEAYLAQQAAQTPGFNQRNTIQLPTMPSAGGANLFYFYNPQTVAQGKTAFENKWGKRPLEDNWRRRDKKISLLPTEDDNVTAAPGGLADNNQALTDTEQTPADETAQDMKTREYYLQQIPFTPDELEASDYIILNGLFNMGMIYKDKLEDITLTAETFEELNRRFPGNVLRLEYYYHTYLMALRFKDTALAEKYKALLKEEFPSDDYTIAISDPDYEYNMRMMDSVQDSIYEMTYKSYLAEDTYAVRQACIEFSAKYPLAKLMPKFMFINALTYVQTGDPEGFKEALTVLTEKYPEADVTELAVEMLKGLLRGRQLMQSNFSTMTWDYRFGAGPGGVVSGDSTVAFTIGIEAPHRMVLIFTTGSVDRNQLLFAVAAYNYANFRVKSFDHSLEEVGALTLLTIKGFNNLFEILDYYRLIYGGNGYAPAFDGVVTFFPFSDANFDILMRGKTLEEYMRFFIANFGEKAPDLVNRWRLRVEADRKELEEKEAEKIKEVPKTVKTEVVKQGITEKTDIVIEKAEAATDKIAVEKEIAISIPEKETVADKPDEIGDERPAAKRPNLFQRLFKRVKETDRFKKIEESLQTIKELAAEEELPQDTVVTAKPLVRVDGELTFAQIQEIRQREAEEKAKQDAEIALSKEEAKKIADAQKQQQAKERQQLQKEKEKATKERLRQQEKERKQKNKERLALQKAKAKESKAAQRAKEKESKTTNQKKK